jgi:hypothetical protein
MCQRRKEMSPLHGEAKESLMKRLFSRGGRVEENPEGMRELWRLTIGAIQERERKREGETETPNKNTIQNQEHNTAKGLAGRELGGQTL